MLKFLFETNSTLPRIFDFCEASYVYKKIIIRPKLNILNTHISQTILFFIFVFCFSSNQFIYESVLFQRSLIREAYKTHNN